MASIFEEVSIEQARSIAEAKRRHYEFIEKMSALMKEYGVEISAANEEIAIWTNFEGESTMSEPAGVMVGHEAVAKEMEYKEWNTPTAEEIFQRHQIWARQARERAAQREQPHPESEE